MLPGMRPLAGGKPLAPMTVTTFSPLIGNTAAISHTFSLTMPAQPYAQLLIIPVSAASATSGLLITSVTWNGIAGVQVFSDQFGSGAQFNTISCWVIEVPILAVATTANVVITKNQSNGDYSSPIACGPYLSPTVRNWTDFGTTPYGDSVNALAGGIVVSFITEWYTTQLSTTHTWTGATEYTDYNGSSLTYFQSAAYNLPATSGSVAVSVAATRTPVNWGMFIGSWR